jgi:3-deoxy-manno-octulosonate cytidylyltransferase (CMP-KDO synthetase)
MSHNSTAKSYVIIPARLASTRLPRKLLLRDTGKTVLQYTFEAASKALRPEGILIAADAEETLQEAAKFGARAVMTSIHCASGTDRVAEASRHLPDDVDILVNVQGDEPEIDPEAIDLVVEILERQPELSMATVCTPIRTRENLNDPACVKVVFDARGKARYFSRSPIPHAREWSDDLLTAEPPHFFQHLGLYAYRRPFVLQLAAMPPARVEQIEKLEQLRVLDAGHEIGVGVIPKAPRGIDTPADYAAFVERTCGPHRRAA